MRMGWMPCHLACHVSCNSQCLPTTFPIFYTFCMRNQRIIKRNVGVCTFAARRSRACGSLMSAHSRRGGYHAILPFLCFQQSMSDHSRRGGYHPILPFLCYPTANVCVQQAGSLQAPNVIQLPMSAYSRRDHSRRPRSLRGGAHRHPAWTGPLPLHRGSVDSPPQRHSTHVAIALRHI